MGYLTKDEIAKKNKRENKAKIDKINAKIKATKAKNIALQLLEEPVIPPISGRCIKVNSIQQAKRLLSKIILLLQKGLIDGRRAKDLVYILSIFTAIVKDSEFDDRLREIENKLSINKLEYSQAG